MVLMSHRPRFNLRQAVRVGAWNIPQNARLALLLRELKWLGAEAAALSEVRKPGRGTISMSGYTYHWSGRGDGHHHQVVTIATRSDFNLR